MRWLIAYMFCVFFTASGSWSEREKIHPGASSNMTASWVDGFFWPLVVCQMGGRLAVREYEGP